MFSADVLIKKTPSFLAGGPQWLKALKGKPAFSIVVARSGHHFLSLSLLNTAS